MVKGRLDLSVLVVGCGSIGKRHARVLHGMGVKDLRACDPIEAQRDGLAREVPARLYSAYEEALTAKPDAVVICTPPKMHVPMARQAIESGAHVFCEKPLSDSSDGIDELVEAVNRTKRKFTVGYCYRYHDGLRKAKGLLDSGVYGRLVSIRCMMGEHLPSVRPDYKALYSSKSGGAYDLLHGVDLAVWFASTPVQRVSCMAGNYSDIGIEAPDFAEMLVGFDRCLASIHLDFFQLARRFEVELICTAGIILVEFGHWDKCQFSTYTAKNGWSHEDMVTARDDMFRAEDGAFLDAIVNGTPVECGIGEARKSLEIVEQAQLDANSVGQLPRSTKRKPK